MRAQAQLASSSAPAIDARLVPVVGEGATFTLWSDSYACTVVSVSKSGLKAVLQRDKATLLNGMRSDAPDKLQFSPGGFCGHVSGEQRYSYERNPDGQLITVTRRTLRDGSFVWKQVGHATRSPGACAYFGRRDEHYDYNF